MIGMIVPKLLIWASRLSVVLRGNRGEIPGANGSGLHLVQQSLGDGASVLIGVAVIMSLLCWVIYALAIRASAPLPFPFLGMWIVIRRGIARHYRRRIIRRSEPYSREIEEALRRAREVLTRHENENQINMPALSSRKGGRT